MSKMVIMMTCRLSTVWGPFIHGMLASYGCFCGAGGEKGKPVDGIDACCKKHDECYDAYINSFSWSGCLQLPYIQTYSTDVGLGCWCAPQTPWYIPYGNNECDYQVCQCDTNFVSCLAGQYAPEYRKGCKSS